MRRVATQLALTSRPAPADMDATAATSAGALADQLLRSGMSAAEGIDALERVLGAETGPRVLVLNGSVAAWQARVEAASTPAPLTPPSATVSSPSEVPADFDEFETAVSLLWKELLGVSVTSRADNFFSHGGHSLIAVRMMSRIERQFRAGLSIAAVFESPTVGALSAAIRAKRSGQTGSATRPGGDALTDETSGDRAPAPPQAPVLSAVPRESFLADLSALPDDDLGGTW
jgi:acyl carrier protein